MRLFSSKTAVLFTLILVVGGVFLFSHFSSALEPIVPCGLSTDNEDTPADETRACGTCDILVLAKNISDFILYYLVPALAALLFVYAGFMILLGGAVPARVQTGKNIFQTTVYGLLIIFTAWLIVNTVLRTVAGDQNIADQWWKLECQEPEIIDDGDDDGGEDGEEEDLTISEVEVLVTSSTEAVVTWKTSKAATSQVKFNDNLRPTTTRDDNKKTVHSVTLDGLTPATSYSIRAVSEDDTGYKAESKLYPFKTLAKDGTENLFRFITSDKLPDGVKNQSYSVPIEMDGGKPPYRLKVRSNSPLPQGLTMTSGGLISGKPTQEFKGVGDGLPITIDAEDSSSPPAKTQRTFTLKILATASPVVISAVAVKDKTTTGATITWTTDKAATSEVKYGTTATLGGVKTESGTRTSHSVTLTGLKSDTTYYYQAYSKAGYEAKSTVYNFKTLKQTGGDGTTPLAISTSTLSDGTVGKTYSQTLAASGGKTPYAWSKTAGNLPAGLTLSSAGVISGKPSKAETSSFTVKVEDSANPKLSVTKPLTIKVITVGTIGAACQGAVCSDSNLNICGQNTSTNCLESKVNAWNTQIQAATSGKSICSGVDTVKMVKAIMSQESGGDIGASNGDSVGLMQMKPSTADAYKSGCTTANIDAAWLKNSANAQASICIAVNYLKSLVSSCGCNVRHLAAAYNGGPSACSASQSCASCSTCGTEKTKRWECLWEGPDGEHKTCNVDRTTGSYHETRVYVPEVSYCYGKFSSTFPPAQGSITISTGTLSNGTVNQSPNYSQTLAASGGKTPYRWAVTSGKLPDGLILSAGGVISGKPTLAGTFDFTVKVEDSSSPKLSNTKQSRIKIDPQAVTGDFCSNSSELAKQHTNAAYPVKRAPELNTLLSCIAGKTGKAVPTAEGGVNTFYGSMYTYDSKAICNYTRGDKHCLATSGKCAHAVTSCHYGGKTGTAGSLAIDFGNEANGNIIIEAAEDCGAKSARCENALGRNVSCTAGSGANHIHISSTSCDAN